MDTDNGQVKFSAMVEQMLQQNEYDDIDETPDNDQQSMSFEENHHHHRSSSIVSNSMNNSFMNRTSASSSNEDSKRDVFYSDDYFDLNDILSQSQKLGVNFTCTVHKLGFLDAGAEDDRMLKGTKLELPLWLVKQLNADGVVNVQVPKGYNQTYREILEADANIVNLNKLGPNFYRFGQHMTAMNLPESEDIAHSMVDTYTQRFQRLVNFALSGSNVGGVKSTPGSLTNGGITKSASKSSTGSSAAAVASSSSSSSSSSSAKASTCSNTDISGDTDLKTLPEMVAYQSKLDNWERECLTIGQATVRQLKRWENRQMNKVVANDLVVTMHKRKRLIEQHMQYQQHNASHLSQGGFTVPGGGAGSSS